MKKEIKEIDAAKGIFRVTTSDERWYTIPDKDSVTGLPTYRYIPSVTWVCGYYPKGVAFYKWLAEKGWDESQSLKQAAGGKGSKVHKAIEMIIDGEEIRMDMKLPNKDTGIEEELTVEEYDAVVSFVEWANKMKPKFLNKEITVISKKYGYAGTVDCIAEIDGEVYVIDWKTSQYIWPEYELQLSAYLEALKEVDVIKDAKLAILQVGYRRNKNAWKWNELTPQFDLFLSARSIWAKEAGGEKPKQKDYPIAIRYTAETVKAKKSKV